MTTRRALLTALLLPAATRAADPLDALRKNLDDAPLLRGRFVQERRMNGFRHALRSSGEFVQVRGRGVLWLARSPFVSSTIVTPERLETRDADGRRTALLDARSEPLLRTVNGVLLATLAGDFAALRAQFALELQSVGSGWRLTLKPLGAALAAQFNRIVIGGERFVQSVSLEERSGDRTEITFTDVQPGPALNATEDAWLAGRGG